jgi:hypothetical protein
MPRFQITVVNVRTLLRLSDKFDIEYLLNEIKVGTPYASLVTQTDLRKIFGAQWVTQEAPSYELWELAASHEIDCLEHHCRLAARKRADEILNKGEGVSYYLSRGIPGYMIDRIIRALFAAREAVIPSDYKGVKSPYL